MKTIYLCLYLLTGKVEKVDDLYTVHVSDNSVVEYACYGEVMNWLETGSFSYNDNLCACGELE